MAIVGLGILALYGLWHAVLAATMLASNFYAVEGMTTPPRWFTALRVIFCLWHFACSLGSPICVALWIIWQRPIFEWTAVGLLFVYFVPYLAEFLLQDYSTSDNYQPLAVQWE